MGGISSPGRLPRGISKLNLHDLDAAGPFKLESLGSCGTPNTSQTTENGSEIGEIGITAEDDKNMCLYFEVVGPWADSSPRSSFTETYSNAPSIYNGIIY